MVNHTDGHPSGCVLFGGTTPVVSPAARAQPPATVLDPSGSGLRAARYQSSPAPTTHSTFNIQHPLPDPESAAEPFTFLLA